MPTDGPVEIRYLFRFRDLIAKTIGAHKAVIDQHHMCWWGWWKRPTESDHDDVWAPLAESAKPEAPVPVGLFDSGSGNVYIARVSRVIPPSTDLSERVAVPPGDDKLIPEYYAAVLLAAHGCSSSR
jgi:hypothetical protein